MRKLEFANSIEIILIIMLFFSILVLMLNSFLPTVILKNSDNLLYFNLESMQYSQNINIKDFYNNINLINYLIWLIIVFIFIAFLGVILNISKIYKKISYLFLSVGSLSIIFSSFSCYLYLFFILKIFNFNEILLAYIIIEPLKYSYIILIMLISIVLGSISYNITTLPLLFSFFKDYISKKQKLTIEKTFKKPVEQINISLNKKKDSNMDFYFKKKNEFANNWFSNHIKFRKELDKSFIKKETKDMEINSNENKSEKSKKINYKKNEIKTSDSLEKALFSAIDKIKRNSRKK